MNHSKWTAIVSGITCMCVRVSVCLYIYVYVCTSTQLFDFFFFKYQLFHLHICCHSYWMELNVTTKCNIFISICEFRVLWTAFTFSGYSVVLCACFHRDNWNCKNDMNMILKILYRIWITMNGMKKWRARLIVCMCVFDEFFSSHTKCRKP